VRAYATNSAGTAYGNMVSFTTDPWTIGNIDGNVYFVVRVGTQLWMKENLKTTHHNEGTEIPIVTDNTPWQLAADAYCWYDNNEVANKDITGELYRGAVNAYCPTGWHILSGAEFIIIFLKSY
jgi:uncharacterized protein (TIGR02145 family)